MEFMELLLRLTGGVKLSENTTVSFSNLLEVDRADLVFRYLGNRVQGVDR